MKTMREKILLASGVCLVLSTLSATLRAQPVEVVVRKPGVEENPTLTVESFAGPPEVARLLEQTLIRCGWFRVQESGPADYQLRATWTGELDDGRMTVAVASGSQTVLTFNTEPGMAARSTVYQAVDIILNRLFEVPGIASSRIAFVMGEGRRKEIHTMNFDGSQVRRITNNNSISTEPSWSGQEYMYYTYYEPSRMTIMNIDLARGRQRRVAYFNGLNSGARISPDGERLAMSLSRDGAVNLYVMSLRNRQLTQLTRGSAVVSSPVWSPDGTEICYVSDQQGRPNLYLVSANGGQSRRLLNHHEEAVEPDWCPFSNQISFSTNLGGRYLIAVVEMATGGPRERRIIMEQRGDWESPSWAPDGRHLVSTRRLGGQRQLMMIDSWLGGVVEITRPASLELPDWSGLIDHR